MNNNISVVINTYNESKCLPLALQRLGGFDEVVVCDMESTDDTVDIARRHGCKVVTFPRGSESICEPARNFAIQSARNEWVLIIDADELVTDELVDYLHRYVNSPDAKDALMIPRLNHIFPGKESVVYPDYQCRLVRKSKCFWPPVIHSRPEISGETDRIDSRQKQLALRHLPADFSRYLNKINKFTDNEVRRRSTQYRSQVSMAALIFQPLFRFVKRYFFKGAILNGKTGYIEAKCDAIYKFFTLVKIYEHQLKNDK